MQTRQIVSWKVCCLVLYQVSSKEWTRNFHMEYICDQNKQLTGIFDMGIWFLITLGQFVTHGSVSLITFLLWLFVYNGVISFYLLSALKSSFLSKHHLSLAA
jgi:hypothetical protein